MKAPRNAEELISMIRGEDMAEIQDDSVDYYGNLGIQVDDDEDEEEELYSDECYCTGCGTYLLYHFSIEQLQESERICPVCHTKNGPIWRD